MAAGITSFLSQVSRQGGFSFSNNFLVEFKSSKGGVSPADFFNPDLLEIFCEEAQLPNSNTATGTQVGLVTGLGSVDYPHTRVFTEFSLTFIPFCINSPQCFTLATCHSNSKFLSF